MLRTPGGGRRLGGHCWSMEHRHGPRERLGKDGRREREGKGERERGSAGQSGNTGKAGPAVPAPGGSHTSRLMLPWNRGCEKPPLPVPSPARQGGFGPAHAEAPWGAAGRRSRRETQRDTPRCLPSPGTRTSTLPHGAARSLPSIPRPSCLQSPSTGTAQHPRLVPSGDSSTTSARAGKQVSPAQAPDLRSGRRSLPEIPMLPEKYPEAD